MRTGSSNAFIEQDTKVEAEKEAKEEAEKEAKEEADQIQLIGTQPDMEGTTMYAQS